MIKKRRRILEIFKQEGEQEIETESEGSVSLSDDTFSLICTTCDQVFSSSEDLESHKQNHSPAETSSFVLNVEKEIFDNHNILTKERAVPTTEDPSKISKSEFNNDKYDSLLETLISSVSPDELFQKASITNEIPEDYSVRNLEVFKIETKSANLNAIEISTKTPKHPLSINSILLLDSRRLKKRTLSKKEEDKNLYPSKKLKCDQGCDEDINFENEVNQKIFKILSRDSDGFCQQLLETESLRFTVTTPLPSLPDHDVSVLPEMEVQNLHSKSSFGRSNKRFQAREKVVSTLYSKAREERALDKVTYRKIKKSKRGTLEYHLKLELDHHMIQVKDEVKEERKEEKENETKELTSEYSGRSTPTELSSQPSTSPPPTPANTNIEIRTKEIPSECQETFPSMPIFV